MYKITIMLSENKKKGKISRERILEGEVRTELQKEIIPVIEELASDAEFTSPTAEYVIERDGLYIDGDIDIKVRKTKNGVLVKLGESLI